MLSFNSSGPNNWQPKRKIGSVENSCAEAAVPTALSIIPPPKSEMPADAATAATLRVLVKPPCLVTLSEKASTAPMREGEHVLDCLERLVRHDRYADGRHREFVRPDCQQIIGDCLNRSDFHGA